MASRIPQSTYARFIMGDFEAIRERIINSSIRTSAPKKMNILPTTPLSQKQVDEALSDPFNQSFKQSLKTHADNIRAEKKIINLKKNASEQLIFIEETLSTLSQKLQDSSLSPASASDSKQNIKNAITLLDSQFKQITSIQDEADRAQIELNKAKKDLAEAIKTQEGEWTHYRNKYLTDLRGNLVQVVENEKDLPPLTSSDIESIEFPDPYQGLHNLFIDRGAKVLPEKEINQLLHLAEPDNTTYFRTKAILGILSLNPSPQKATQLMNQLNPLFQTAENEGEHLYQQQVSQTRLIDEKILPIIQQLQSSNTLLKELKQTREEQLIRMAAATQQEISQIHEKVEQRAVIPSTRPK